MQPANWTTSNRVDFPLSSETADKVTTMLFNLSAMDNLVDKGLEDIKAIKWQSKLVRGQNLPVSNIV
ncbi:hypothetical protein SERLA73DRAFT_79624 [Serpula lacrymans var. lacrymans S7.3]|uniref:Uncharacterized protein n=1 Tax=Serpula lacrymans var. lacrymans (strain S7.3) TaxID=936435 RepID=F8QH06_SERL3|nr:hypothetical protein SERLA73DRAFT_79624 [Serpula lacrymans var. lacrymans S7.3]